MKKRNRLTAAVLSLSLCIGLLAGCGGSAQPQPSEEETVPQAQTAQTEASAASYQLGTKLPDFSFTDYEGKTVTLYETLQEKKLVLLNFWATWCGPCGYEFPFMEEAYRQYSDRVEIFAMSVEPSDSDRVLSEYAARQELTFPMGRDSSGLGSVFAYSGIPTTVLVDRFGTICLIETGAQTGSETFMNIFEIYTADDYGESVVIQSMRTAKPTAQSAGADALAEALNGEGESLAFFDSENPFVWPMQVSQKDGRGVVIPSNAGIASSEAGVSATLEAKAGDTVEITFQLACREVENRMRIEVDGKAVKTFSSNRDWTSFAYAFEEDGTHTVSVFFVNGSYNGDSGDTLWLDSIRHLTGEEAKASLQANPVYPVGEENAVDVQNPDLQKLVFYEIETDAVVTEGYICPEGTAELLVTLDASTDAELAYLMDSSYVPRKLADHAEKDGYRMTWQVTKQQVFHDVALFVGDTLVDSVFLFVDESCVEQFAQLLNPGFAWKYAEGDTGRKEQGASQVSYTVRYTDESGKPVAGVMCQVCDDSLCQVYVSDEKGECRFELVPFAYEVHTLKAPEGYAAEETSVHALSENGGVLEIVLKKK